MAIIKSQSWLHSFSDRFNRSAYLIQISTICNESNPNIRTSPFLHPKQRCNGLRTQHGTAPIKKSRFNPIYRFSGRPRVNNNSVGDKRELIRRPYPWLTGRHSHTWRRRLVIRDVWARGSFLLVLVRQQLSSLQNAVDRSLLLIVYCLSFGSHYVGWVTRSGSIWALSIQFCWFRGDLCVVTRTKRFCEGNVAQGFQRVRMSRVLSLSIGNGKIFLRYVLNFQL